MTSAESVSLCVCVCVSLSLSLCVCVCVCVSVSMCVGVVCVRMCVFVCILVTCWLILARLQCRDSKLTRILEDSIGGNCKTTMMAMISPALEAYAGKAPNP